MNRGERRTDILSECPEEFHDKLASFLDDLESEVSGIASALDIKGIGDLLAIEDAYNMADALADSLY